MIVVASQNGSVGIEEAMRVLRAGGPACAVRAVEAGIRLVEANPEDHTVGYGGYPNLLGEVELDAGLMDGHNRTTGAVGALRGYRHPISVARLVMERLPHVLLVGEGASRFAAEMGCERGDLLTEEARRVWERRLQQEPALAGLTRDELAGRADLWRWLTWALDPELPFPSFPRSAWEGQRDAPRRGDSAGPRQSVGASTEELVETPGQGTVNFIAQDAGGHLCAGTSTSGWAWKYPGRLGDSPMAGAGFYADDRYGAATCTGMGEMAIRVCAARSVVFYLQMGLPLAEAGQRVMQDLADLGGNYLDRLSIIAVDRAGRHAGFSNMEKRTYIYLTDDMTAPAEASCTCVPTPRRWGTPRHSPET